MMLLIFLILSMDKPEHHSIVVLKVNGVEMEVAEGPLIIIALKGAV